jgi:AraC-like DNA-binding protein
MTLSGAQLQYYDVPESSDYAHLLKRTFSVTAQQEGCTVPLLPSACVTLLFPREGRALLCGPLTTLHQLSLAPGASLYGVSLRCGCGDWLWSDSMTELTDRVVALDPLFPGSDKLCAALWHCFSLTEQNALFTRLATVHGGRSYQSAALLRRCLTPIEQQRGQVRVADLAQSVGCSERHLNRLMHQKVGLSTKTVCQLHQLHHSLHTMLTTPSRSLLHLAVNCGYFDQAHMNRHYHRFLTCSANHIRRHGTFPVGVEITQPN